MNISGQTGSGKTFTLLNNENGLVPLFGESIFRQLEDKGNFSQLEYVIEMSVLEIYNESCYDMLNNSTIKLKIR